MMKEFKDFALKGNVIDLAIGVIIGSVFGKIINSLVEDVITPLLLKPAMEAANLNTLENLTIFGSVKYGVFLSSVINFVIVAFILFMVVRGINSMKKKEMPISMTPSKEAILLSEIRDLLKSKNRENPDSKNQKTPTM